MRLKDLWAYRPQRSCRVKLARRIKRLMLSFTAMPKGAGGITYEGMEITIPCDVGLQISFGLYH